MCTVKHGGWYVLMRDRKCLLDYPVALYSIITYPTIPISLPHTAADKQCNVLYVCVACISKHACEHTCVCTLFISIGSPWSKSRNGLMMTQWWNAGAWIPAVRLNSGEERVTTKRGYCKSCSLLGELKGIFCGAKILQTLWLRSGTISPWSCDCGL